MQPVPMSIFVDFAMTSGTPRVTLVTRWRREENDNHDFYRGFKHAVVAMHAQGKAVDSLRPFLLGQKDARRKRIYPELAESYRAWLAKLVESHAGVRFAKRSPPVSHFGGGAVKLNVIVDPLLAVEIGGTVYYVKLYLRSEQPTKKRVEVTLALMRAAYEETARHKYALLDLRRGKLHVLLDTVPTRARCRVVSDLLHGELAAFNAIYWRV